MWYFCLSFLLLKNYSSFLFSLKFPFHFTASNISITTSVSEIIFTFSLNLFKKKCEVALPLFNCFDSEIWSTLWNRHETNKTMGIILKTGPGPRPWTWEKTNTLKSWYLGKTGPQGLKALPFFSSNMKDDVEVIHFHRIFYINLIFSYSFI